MDDSAKVISLVERNSTNFQTFVLGIGGGVDKNLVMGMAKAGKGAHDFTGQGLAEDALNSAGESIQSKVVRLVKESLGKKISDITLDWGKLDPVKTTSVPSSVVSGERILVHAFADSSSTDMVRGV